MTTTTTTTTIKGAEAEIEMALAQAQSARAGHTLPVSEEIHLAAISSRYGQTLHMFASESARDEWIEEMDFWGGRVSQKFVNSYPEEFEAIITHNVAPVSESMMDTINEIADANWPYGVHITYEIGEYAILGNVYARS